MVAHENAKCTDMLRMCKIAKECTQSYNTTGNKNIYYLSIQDAAVILSVEMLCRCVMNFVCLFCAFKVGPTA